MRPAPTTPIPVASGAAPEEAADDAAEEAELLALEAADEALDAPLDAALDMALEALLEMLDAFEDAALEAELRADEIELEMLASLAVLVADDSLLEPADSIELVTEARDEATDEPALEADTAASLDED